MSKKTNDELLNFIERKSSNNFVPKKSESKIDCIKKATHLYMNDKLIKNIGNITVCENLGVLYLHNNEITKIENINCAENLTALYIQNNKISKIENLSGLKKLRKLHIGHNYIRVVEGLETINLEELHCDKQNLPKGEALCFDPRTIANLSHTLNLLNISYNNITSLDELAPLKNLIHFNASFNKLCDIQEVCNIISEWYYLKDVLFKGNPMSKIHRYRETVIANTYRLKNLDNKDISETTRCFIKRFEKEKMNANPCLNFANDIPGLSKDLSLTMQKAVSFSMIKPQDKMDDFTALSKDTNIYIPWKALPNHNPLTKQKHQKSRKRSVDSLKTIEFITTTFSNLKNEI